jgi:hypothetical protein
MNTITSTLKGTQKQFEHLYKAITLEDKDRELIPQEVETRVYVLDCQDISTDKGFEELTEEEWITECERQGRVYTLNAFQRAFNEEEINPSIDVIRIINVLV